MKKFLIFVISLLLIGILQGSIIAVDIEGNGDHTSIQAGINASVNGDTVLVYPGRYYENIDFNGRSIAIGSLEMITGNRDYIHCTIIDGNQSGSCVVVNNDEEDGTKIRGFTLINGNGYSGIYGTRGGGLFLSEVDFDVMNCIVENNLAEIGGGVLIDGGNVTLAGNTIRNNEADLFGGGITSWNLVTPFSFSSENRNSVYSNFAIMGLDIYNQLETSVLIDVIVDTFTVSEPFGYEFYQGDNSDVQNYEDSIFEMQHARYERVEADMYVSPDGDDSNSGLSWESPLQTINQALHVITADADNPRTIFLADGIYSSLLNDQKFPISMRSYVSIIGESEDNTIIDLGIGHQGFVVDRFSDLGYEFRNFTVRNGFLDNDDSFYHRIFYILNSLDSTEPVLMENLNIHNNGFVILLKIGTVNLTLRNVDFHDNYYTQFCTSISLNMNDQVSECTALLENCTFRNNHTGHINVLSSHYNDPSDYNFNIVNCEFFNNDIYNNQTVHPVQLSLSCEGGVTTNIVNSIFTDNQLEGIFIESAPIHVIYGAVGNIINSIIYGNETSHAVIISGDSILPCEVNVHHSIIENGINGIYSNGSGILNWDDETNWDEDPLFMYEGDYPYSLQEGSPAIDVGTLELPDGVELPEYDLAGNPRIMGNGIELGAYEYDPSGNNADDEIIEVNNQLIVYPNPLMAGNQRNDQANILWQGETSEDLSFEIFNIKGQRVRKLEIENVKCKIGDGSRNVVWDGKDDTGKPVSSGVYFVRVKTGDDYIAQSKLTVVK